MSGRVLIVGIGNRLAGDDGAGVAVVDALERLGLPAHARIERAGTDATCLPLMWQGESEVWLVDAVRGGAPAGTMHRVPHEELLALPQTHESAHRLSLPECLRWIAIAHPELASVRYELFGIEPGAIEAGRGLSPEVERAVPTVAEAIAIAIAQRRER